MTSRRLIVAPEAWTQHYRLNLGDWKRHDVRYGLKADLLLFVPACRKASLNHVGGRHKQSIGQREPQRRCRLFIKEEFDLCGLFDREISGFGSLHNLVYENSRTATHRRLVSSIGH